MSVVSINVTQSNTGMRFFVVSSAIHSHLSVVYERRRTPQEQIQTEHCLLACAIAIPFIACSYFFYVLCVFVVYTQDPSDETGPKAKVR